MPAFTSFSHEIRTPLNIIVGVSQLLKTIGSTDPQIAELSDALEIATQTLLRLSTDILETARRSGNSFSIQPHPCNMAHLVKEVASLLLPEIRQKGLTLDIIIDSAVPDELMADAVRIRQVLTNLLDNACKYTSKGGIKLYVSVVSTTDALCRIRFEVEDTGAGISIEDQPWLFQPYFQATNTLPSSSNIGVGLGLSICHNLIDRMNGEMDVLSHPGNGSLFWFEIPFTRLKAQKTNLSQQSVVSDDQRKVLDSKQLHSTGLPQSFAKLLLVEDNRVSRIIMSRLLEAMGYAHDTVETGLQAIEAITHQSYGLVLLDCELPDINGYHVTRHVRQLLKKTVPIIGLTGYALAEDEINCREVGMNDFLTKPVDTDKLAKRIAFWLANDSPLINV